MDFNRYFASRRGELLNTLKKVCRYQIDIEASKLSGIHPDPVQKNKDLGIVGSSDRKGLQSCKTPVVLYEQTGRTLHDFSGSASVSFF